MPAPALLPRPCRALDLGCAVGGAAFEMARVYGQVRTEGAGAGACWQERPMLRHSPITPPRRIHRIPSPLSRSTQVVGIDLSQRFIDAANQMKADRRIEYSLKVRVWGWWGA